VEVVCVPLFSALAMLVQEITVFVSYVKNHTFAQPLSRGEEEAALREFRQSGDLSARNRLIEHNLRLVAHIVKKYDHGAIDVDDLISIGTIGLIKAVQTFDPDKNVRLATYAARCIENEVLMYLRSVRRTGRPLSLEEPIGQDKDGRDVALQDLMKADLPEMADVVQAKLDRASIYDGLRVLNEREREVIWERFGLPYGEEKTQREIARELGISRSYVSRIEKRALEKLQDALKSGR